MVSCETISNITIMVITLIKNLLKKIPVILTVIFLTFNLTSCVNYETGISFYNSTSGIISQHIKISEQLIRFSPDALNEWVRNIHQRAKKLNGKVIKEENGDFLLTIPFSNPQDLAKKFNNLLTPTGLEERQNNISAKLEVTDNNFIVASRYNLNWTIDLQQLNVPTNDKVIIDSNSLLNLGLVLNSPSEITLNQENSPQIKSNHNQLYWQLEPGKGNNLSVSLWLINPLGIGAIIITILAIFGYYLKYRKFPGLT
jgi:hypothetical protein